ncbi:MAG: DNA polymerase I, partial [Gammaproteobacteria bacterium]|nr:DNA polymerase I [Gammaproteobacteria bacterium]
MSLIKHTNAESTIILVDGSSYLYRAFHAMPALTNSRGESTGAIYGMVNMLRRLRAEFPFEYTVMVFDAKGRTFRNELYVDYKANRSPMPDDLVCQIEPIHAVVRAMGFPLLMVPGVEADDVIGTLASRADVEGLKVVISTGDKDMSQLVNDRILIVNTMDNSTLDPAGVEAKFGIPPGLIIDYLTLVGDAVDNVPGVPKVGPKTAVKWLKQYGSLDGVMEHAVEIKGKVGENLRASLEQLPLSRKLVTIKCDVPLEKGPWDLKMLPPDRTVLRELFVTLEFKNWLVELSPEAGVAKSIPETVYETVLEWERFEEWLDILKGAELISFDTETTSLDYMVAEIVGVSFAVEPGRAAYVPVGHDYLGVPVQLDRRAVLDALRPLLENHERPKVGQNLKYDMSVLARYGIHMRGIRYDTMLESYVLDSTATRHDMDSLALKYLSHQTVHYEDVAGKGVKQLSFNQVELDKAGPYAAEDADITLKLHRVLWPRLQQEASLKKLFDGLEMPLVPILSRMERNGVLMDRAMLASQSVELAERMLTIEQDAFKLAGGPFNLGSPKQIQSILFDKMGLPVRAKTPKGQPSTAESVMQDLAMDYPLPQLILEYRSLSKLRSTYTDSLPGRINPVTGRVHTSYHQAVAATGRLSSSEPNLQNIPVRTPEGRRIRQAFVGEPRYRLLAADYSQIELRIMAHLSEDEGLLQAFSQGVDIHRATAAEVFATPVDAVTNGQRRSAKAINFGLIYGMSAFGLARQLGIQRAAAQEYVDLYFSRYPGVKGFMGRTREQAHDQGYVETVFGRRLYLPEINSRNTQRRQYAER